MTPNIGPGEARRRLRGSIVPLGVALVGAAALKATGSAPLTALALLPAFWGAALGWFQYREKT